MSEAQPKLSVTCEICDNRPSRTEDCPDCQAFRAWAHALPEKHWAKHDISACRMGWDAAKANYAQASITTTEYEEALAESIRVKERCNELLKHLNFNRVEDQLPPNILPKVIVHTAGGNVVEMHRHYLTWEERFSKLQGNGRVIEWIFMPKPIPH